MKTTIINETTPVFQKTAFGVSDTKGREIGVRVRTSECDVVDAPADGRSYYTHLTPGHKFCCVVQSTRGGESYGSSQSENRFTTLEERDAYIAKRLADGKKQAIKKFVP